MTKAQLERQVEGLELELAALKEANLRAVEFIEVMAKGAELLHRTFEDAVKQIQELRNASTH